MNEQEKETLEEAWHPPPEAPPEVSTHLLLALTVAVLMVFAFAVLATWVAMRDEQRKINPGGGSVPARLGQAEINLLRQAPMVLETRAYAEHDDAKHRLESYGWADRDAGEIHVPIERAMQHVIDAQGATGGEKGTSDGGVPWGR